MSSSFPLLTWRVRIAGATDVGQKRSQNEDHLLLLGEEPLVAVLDGMGGHAAGELASQLAGETLQKYFTETLQETEQTWPFQPQRTELYEKKRLCTAIELANRQVYQTSNQFEEFKGMGTTVVAARFFQDAVLVVHVGDSRLYRYRNHQLKQLTEDHSLRNEYKKYEHLQSYLGQSIPPKNVLVRALGIKHSVQIDAQILSLEKDDLYLLCSDGLSDMLTDEDIAHYLEEAPDLNQACDDLIAAANHQGGVDNITVVLARVEEL